jgi:membrane protein involved in colicin uptake
MPPKTNSKVEKANAKKAAGQAVKDNAAAAAAERAEAADWSVGSNAKGANRANAAAEKADEAARKKREKEALLAEEEGAMGGGGKPKAAGIGKKNAKNKKDDLSFLEDSLVGAAEKKAKAKKEADRKKAEAEKKKQEEAAARKAAASSSLTGNGIVDVNDLVGDGMGGLQGNVNAPAEDDGVSGIDSGLSVFGFGNEKSAISEKNRRALHLQFEEKMMDQMKADHPGLRLQQYKDRIFELWKKSPENPANAPTGGGRAGPGEGA